MKLFWVLVRAALEAGIAAIAREGNAPGEGAGQSSGAGYLLLAAGIAALFAAAPGLFFVLMLAGLSPGAL